MMTIGQIVMIMVYVRGEIVNMHGKIEIEEVEE